MSQQQPQQQQQEATSQQFCVRWNSHLPSLGASVTQLLMDDELLDATIYCEGHGIRCHRMVLASCSPLFHKVLVHARSPEPSIILANSIKAWQIEALLQFMYKGEVNVSPEGLQELVAAAEQLEIRGLCNREENSPLPNIVAMSQQQQTPPQPSSQTQTTATTATATTTPSPLLELITDSEGAALIGDDATAAVGAGATLTPSARISTSTPLSNGNDNTQSSSSLSGSGHFGGAQIKMEMPSISEPEISSEPVVAMDESELRSEEENQHHLIQTQLQQQQQPSQQQQQQSQDEQQRSTSSLSLSWTTASSSNSKSTCASPQKPTSSIVAALRSKTRCSLLSTATSSSSASASLVTITKDSAPPPTSSAATTTTTLSSLISAQRQYPDLSVISKITAASKSADVTGAGDDGDVDTDDNNFTITTAGAGATYDDDIADIYVVDEIDHHHADVCVEIEEDDLPVNNTPTSTTPTTPTTRGSTNAGGKIRVKSKENLFGSAATTSSVDRQDALRNRSTAAETTTGETSVSLPGSLHFNRNTMTVFVKPPATTRVLRKRLGVALDIGSSPPPPPESTRMVDEDYEEEEEEEEGEEDDADENDATNPEFHTMTIKTEYNPIEEGNYESIVCSPNVLEMYTDSETGHGNGSDCFDDIKLIDKDVIYAQPVNSPHELLQYHHHMSVVDRNYSEDHHYNDKLQIRSMKDPSALGYATVVPQYLADSNGGDDEDEDDDEGDGGGGRRNPTTLLVNSRSTNGKLHKCHYLTTTKRGPSSMKPMKRMANDLECNLNAMVLRSPRSNQPRTYSIDALYAALMDVKGGESIYKASRMHNVPRKTLRNWMKRWEIKSAYPMPRQLKQAAEKRKRMQLQMGSGGSGGGNGGGGGGGGTTSVTSASATRSSINVGAGPSGYTSNSYHQQQQQQHQRQHNMSAGSTCAALLQQSSHRQQSHSSSSLSISKNLFDTKKS